MLLILAVAFASMISCKKSGTASPLSFTFTGTLRPGYLVTFHCNKNANSYLWTFGDGSKSTDSVPSHTYAGSGSFSVTLTVNNDSAAKVIKTIAIGPAFDFTYSGISAAGYELTFTSNATTGSTFQWNFGDGNTSPSNTPKHTYDSNGSFHVSLTLDNDTAHTITKTITVFNNAVYVSQIPGTRIYHHIFTDARPIPPYHTAYTKPDTSLTITMVDPVTVSIGADTLAYDAAISSDTVLAFGHSVFLAVMFNELYFNRRTSAIDYYKYVHVSAGSGEQNDHYYYP